MARAKKKKPTAAPTPRRSTVVTRQDGRELRRLTLYLPTDLAKRLAVYCAEEDLDKSAVVTAAVATYLGPH